MRKPQLHPLVKTSETLAMLAGILVLSACGGNADSPPGTAPAGAVSESPGSATSCITAYAANPCDLLTAELVRDHVAEAPAEMEQTDIGAKMESLGMSTTIGGMAQNGCTYSWQGGRTRSLKSPFAKGGDSEVSKQIAAAMEKMTRNLPVDDSVTFKSIRQIEADDPVARFEQQWRAPTDEERRMLSQRMGEKMDEAREEGKLSESGAEMGKNLGESFANAAIDYQAVEGVGMAARWGGLGTARELRVLDGATEFAVVVDVSDDEQANRELAIALARDLLARCDG